MGLRRHALPAGLAAVAVVAGALAVRGPAGVASARPPAALAVPVLSPRRAPEALSRVVGDLRLRRDLDAALADPQLGAARSANCLVVDDGGRRLYERTPDASLLPASNLKLLTGAAILDRLGPGTRLRTEVRGARPAGGNVDGPLWLVGGGDPLLGTADFAASFERQPRQFTSLEALADRVVKAGVRHVSGGIVGDETRYDRERYVPTWIPSYVSDSEIGPASALTVNDNFVSWHPRHITAAAPATAAAALFTALLRERGVDVDGSAAEGAAPPVSARLATIDSATVGELVGEMLRESDNQTAEMLVKELDRRRGGRGSTVNGMAVVRSDLASMDLPLAGLATVDGSGLDRSDRATCRLLLSVLEHAPERAWLTRGLPVAAHDGTLARHFHGSVAAGRLRAKTGSLKGVAGLTGLAATVRGGTLAFSLLVNGLPHDALGVYLYEKVGGILVRYPDVPKPAQLAVPWT